MHRFDRRFDFVLPSTGTGGAHPRHLRLVGDVEALDQDLALVRRLDQPQIRQGGCDVDRLEPDVALADPPREILGRAERIGDAAGLQDETDARAPGAQRLEERGRFLVVDVARSAAAEHGAR